MKKWSEIKQATLYKLFLEEEEAKQQNYLEKFQYLANECLNVISNGVKPKISTFSIKIYPAVFVVDINTLTDYKQGVVYVDTNTDVRYEFNGVSLLETNKNIKSDTITMPDDFLSFADLINYLDGNPDPEIIYLTYNQIELPQEGSYKIFYNASWTNITLENIKLDTVLNIDTSVLSCLPTYMASQLLSQDDVQRSTILKNEFELMLSRLDTNSLYESNHFKSNGGWY